MKNCLPTLTNKNQCLETKGVWFEETSLEIKLCKINSTKTRHEIDNNMMLQVYRL